MTAISYHERPAPAGPAAASLAFAWRSLLKIKHVPEQTAPGPRRPDESLTTSAGSRN